MQGNCTGVAPPYPNLDLSHAPLRPLLPRQCLLLADDRLMEVDSSKLWLDGLYVRLTTPRDTSGVFDGFILVSGSGAEVWMTGVTLQGNGDKVRDCDDCGLRGSIDAAVYAEGAGLT